MADEIDIEKMQRETDLLIGRKSPATRTVPVVVEMDSRKYMVVQACENMGRFNGQPVSVSEIFDAAVREYIANHDLYAVEAAYNQIASNGLIEAVN